MKILFTQDSRGKEKSSFAEIIFLYFLVIKLKNIKFWNFIKSFLIIILQHYYHEDVMKKIASFESLVWNKKTAMFHINLVTVATIIETIDCKQCVISN